VKQTASKRFHKQEQEFTIAKHAKVTPTSQPYTFNEHFSNQLCTITEALEKDVYETRESKSPKKQENKQVIVKDGEKAKY